MASGGAPSRTGTVIATNTTSTVALSGSVSFRRDDRAASAAATSLDASGSPYPGCMKAIYERLERLSAHFCGHRMSCAYHGVDLGAQTICTYRWRRITRTDFHAMGGGFTERLPWP